MLKTNFKNLLCHSAPGSCSSLRNKTQKKQVHGQEVVPVGISVLKKQVSWLCNQNLFRSRIFLWWGAGEECKSGGLIRPSGLNKDGQG